MKSSRPIFFAWIFLAPFCEDTIQEYNLDTRENVSIVIPLFSEEEIIDELIRR